jgi:AhpD family alkylhydroperoxidase
MAKKQSEHYQMMKERHPAILDALENLGKTLKNEGPLDEKTAQLIQLAAAAAIRSEGSVHSHTRRALSAGATADEVHHTILLLTGTIGFPNVAAALSWADDVFGVA